MEDRLDVGQKIAGPVGMGRADIADLSPALRIDRNGWHPVDQPLERPKGDTLPGDAAINLRLAPRRAVGAEVGSNDRQPYRLGGGRPNMVSGESHSENIR